MLDPRITIMPVRHMERAIKRGEPRDRWRAGSALSGTRGGGEMERHEWRTDIVDLSFPNFSCTRLGRHHGHQCLLSGMEIVKIERLTDPFETFLSLDFDEERAFASIFVPRRRGKGCSSREVGWMSSGGWAIG